jgi:hypothetical protein
MHQAMKAVENAISLEVKKDGLFQRQSGDWQLRFTVAAIDMHQRVTSAPMGTRFACVLVEISDNEEPVDHKAKERDKWRELGPARQAGLRCKDPVFWAFLEAERYDVSDEPQAADAVRDICGVASRSDLNAVTQSAARLSWHDLDNRFQAWRVVEHG